MFKDRVFQAALFVSVLTHGAVLCNMPHFNFDSLNKSMQKVEITYQGFQLPKTNIAKATKPEKTYKNVTEFNKISVKKQNKIVPAQLAQPIFPPEKPFAQTKPSIIKTLESIKKVSIPTIEAKIDNPLYLDYYQQIRETIRRSVFRNFTKMRSGEVCLAFIVLSDGTLTQINLIEEKSQADEYLKQIALKSLKESAPFPVFPADLKYPELSFNVIISFEIGE